MSEDTITQTAHHIRDLIDGINRTWLQGDPAELVDFFHPDVVIQPPGDTPRVYGIGPCIESYAAFVRDARVRQFTPGAPKSTSSATRPSPPIVTRSSTRWAVLNSTRPAASCWFSSARIPAGSSPGGRC